MISAWVNLFIKYDVPFGLGYCLMVASSLVPAAWSAYKGTNPK